MAISGFGSKSERICIPGEYLFSADEGYAPGNGCFLIHGHIHSGLAGVVSVSKVSFFDNFPHFKAF
jgi:hypothetical protein